MFRRFLSSHAAVVHSGNSVKYKCMNFSSSAKLRQQYPPTLAIRRETVNLWERRAPLAPSHVRRLVKEGIRVLIQPSNRRAYTELEYRKAGAEVMEDISPASLIVGVKKMPLDHQSLMPNKTYAFFSHTIKAQEDNMDLLDTILERKIRLIDYEKMLDERGNRVVAFGQYAGITGMINILNGIGIRLLALGHHTPFMHIGLAHNYRTVEMAVQSVRDAGYEISLGNMPESIGPLIFVFTGTGNVSKGAQEVFMNLPYEFVRPEHLKEVAKNGSRNKIYACVTSRESYLRRRESNANSNDGESGGAGDGVFDAQEYRMHPERYISTFSKDIAPYASVIINGIYWEPNCPRLLTIPDAKHLLRPQIQPWDEKIEGAPLLPHRLIACCDISADPYGSIEFMEECTTIDKPFCLYDAEQNKSYEQFFGPGLLICSIDNMPAQMPRPATKYFGSVLLPYIYQMIKSDANTPLDQFDVPDLIKNAVIASNGQLTENYAYIDEMRKQREVDAKTSRRVAAAGGDANVSGIGGATASKRKVLILGSGFVVAPIVEYLGREKKISVTLVSNQKTEVLRIADQFDFVEPEIMDIFSDGDRLAELVRSHEIVVSMVPWKYHRAVLEQCCAQGRDLVTASYCTPALAEMRKQIEQAGITALMEMGLDPGLDHMAAMETFDDVHARGGRVLSYKSFTGGLPAPEFSDNPLRYKFSWSPESALMTATNAARYMEHGKIREIASGGDVMLATQPVARIPGFNLECYPNRDSTLYMEKYGLRDVHTLLRGTYRYRGYSDAVWSLIQMGFLSDKPHSRLHQDGPDITWRQFMCDSMNMEKDVFSETIKDAVFHRLGDNRFKFNCLQDLGLFSDELIEKCNTPLATISKYLADKLAFQPHERDLVVMTHEIGVEWADRSLQRTDLEMVIYGKAGGYSAMAKTVGYPVAIGVKMILDREIQKQGIVMPMTSDIYRPILKRLKSEGIEFKETISKVEKL